MRDSSVISAAPTSLRERRKAEKFDAIRKAARYLFATHGFYKTPMREVARVADVGFGTVSAYAADKAGLAAMLFVEDLDQLPAVFSDLSAGAPLLDQVIDNFSLTFRFWASNPELSRVVLSALGEPNRPFVDLILHRRASIRSALITWLRAFQQIKVITTDVNIEQAAELLFALYIACVKEWLSAGESDVESGIDRMRFLMEIPVAAMCRHIRRRI